MYETEEQQVEAIKKWWQENGKSIIAGVILGLGGVFGWKAWVEHTDGVAAQASNIFDQLVLAVETAQTEQARQQASLLHQEYSSTPYAAFATLMLARLHYEQKDVPATIATLEQAIEQAPDRALKTIAAMRLARVHIGADQLDAAAQVLQQHQPPAAFLGEYAALRADIAQAKGDLTAARDAYQQAIAANASNRELLQLKLENLPPAPAT
jgi:predicted negative regulator of RcsB-dependent stress response